MERTSERMLLIDAYAQIYRGFHAIPALTNARGEPTNALYAVANFLLRLDRDLPHSHGAVIFDKGAPAARLRLLPEYKATRPAMPDAMRIQLPMIREWIAHAGWPMLEEEGREADDIIAAVVAADIDCEVLIVSHDKDLAQLVRANVALLQPGRRGAYVRLDSAGVEEKYGVSPAAIVDYLALIGDTSDNIPGISGVGPKTAAALLREFGSIDTLYSRLAEVSRPALRAKLASGREQLERNRQLITLDTTLPASWSGAEALFRRAPNWEKLLAMARDHGFKSMLPALEKARRESRNPTLF